MALIAPATDISRVFYLTNPRPSKLRGVKISTTVKKFGSNHRVRICAEVRDCGVRVSEGNESLMLYGQFSAQVKQSSSPSKEEEERQSYYVNIGYAIRTIREEFPELFYRELSFDIYRF